MISHDHNGAVPRGAGASAPGADPRSRRRWQAACLGAFALLGLLTVAAATVGVLPGEPTLRDGLLAWTTPEVTALARAVNPGGSWRVLLPGMLIVFALSPDGRRRWWLWSAVLVAGAIVETSLKTGLARPRPEDVSAGFPSGHATSAAAFAVIVVYLAGRARLSPPARAALSGAVLVGACLVGMARIELRAHWPSDVLAGWAIGAGIAAAAAWWDLASRAGTPSAAARCRPGAVPAGPRAAQG